MIFTKDGIRVLTVLFIYSVFPPLRSINIRLHAAAPRRGLFDESPACIPVLALLCVCRYTIFHDFHAADGRTTYILSVCERNIFHAANGLATDSGACSSLRLKQSRFFICRLNLGNR